MRCRIAIVLKRPSARSAAKCIFRIGLICRECGNREFETINVSAIGKLISYTVIHTPASQFKDESPYALGICEFPEGVKITAQIVDIAAAEIKTGMDLQIEFRRVQTDGHAGVIGYGYKFVPVI